MYDLIIIGAGPAGLSAAIYGVRKKLKTLVLCQHLGGQAAEAHAVENYPGIPGISGAELSEKITAHAKKLGAEIKEGITIKRIAPTGDIFEIQADKDTFQGRAIILATGKKYRQLEIPGAAEFESKGISYCTTCDAPLFSGKTVAVIGAGDAGQDAAWQLTKYAAKIYLLNKYAELRGAHAQLHEHLSDNEKVEICANSEPVEIKGGKFVKGLVYKCGDDTKEIAVDGIFVEIGAVPASELARDLVKFNKKDEIVIDPKTNMTSRTGIFAAGDVTDTPQKQMIVAAGEGAKAALGAAEYLKSLQNTDQY